MRAALRKAVRPLVEQLAADLVDVLASRFEGCLEEAVEVARSAFESALAVELAPAAVEVDEPAPGVLRVRETATPSTEPTPAPKPRAASRRPSRVPPPASAPSPSPKRKPRPAAQPMTAAELAEARDRILERRARDEQLIAEAAARRAAAAPPLEPTPSPVEVVAELPTPIATFVF